MLLRGSDLTGIEKIDDSHQDILDRFDRLISYLERSNSQMTLNQLHDLLDTASEHFSHEESFLKSRDNQDLLKHIGTHGFMLNQLYSLMLAITGQQNSRFSAEDIRQYWIEHFRHEAQKLRQHH